MMQMYRREILALVALALVAGVVIAAEVGAPVVRTYVAPKPKVSEMANNVGSPVGQVAPGVQVHGGQMVSSMPTAREAAQPMAQQYTQQLAAMAANPMAVQPFDRVLGDPKAPVTLVEFASLTCSHCAHFHKDTLPLLKRNWIDTGKAKLIYRDLAWDNLAMGMAKVARCVPNFSYFGVVGALFAAQEQIVTSDNPLQGINRVARMAGLDEAKVQACVKDSDLHVLVNGMKEVALNKLGITGTPTLLIGRADNRISGAEPYEKVDELLRAASAVGAGTPVKR